MTNAKHFGITLLLSWTLAMTSCAGSPPCHREDLQAAYDAQGQRRDEALTVTKGCFERMLGDLKACYKEAK